MKTFANVVTSTDVTVADFSHLMDFFSLYGASVGQDMSYGRFHELEMNDPELFNSILAYRTWPVRNQRVKAVEITCKGDRLLLKTPKFIAVEIPDNHPVFYEVSISVVTSGR
jgi:hypothetical protein